MALITNSTGAFVNGRPTVIGAKVVALLHDASHVFTVANVTSETTPAYNDPEGDDLSYLRIKSLPVTGTLKLSGVDVILNQDIPTAQIGAGNLIYDAPIGTETSYSEVILFDIADLGSETLSGLSGGQITFNIAAKINLPPDNVGDNTINLLHGDTRVFNTDDFTIDTTPQYSDPEGDVADKLKITSLPSTGNLRYNGVNVIVNQIITFSDIDAELFTYVPNVGITTAQTLTFGIEIADAGSGNFTS